MVAFTEAPPARAARESSEGSHWYTTDGKPMHQVPRAKGGGTRPTTLADARKLGLLPSVTSIIGIVAKDALINWKLRQAVEAAINSTRDPGESMDDYIDRVVELSRGKAMDAADLGTKIHKALEQVMVGEPYDAEMEPYVRPVLRWRESHGIEFIERERPLANPKEGYAGTPDGIVMFNGRYAVLDYKSKRTKPGKAVEPYPAHRMQMAANAATYFGVDALPGVAGINVFISTTEFCADGTARLDVCAYDGLAEYYDLFLAAAKLWRMEKGFDPRRAG